MRNGRSEEKICIPYKDLTKRHGDKSTNSSCQVVKFECEVDARVDSNVEKVMGTQVGSNQKVVRSCKERTGRIESTLEQSSRIEST